MSESSSTVFQAVGGLETFRRLVDAFYRGVEGDPLLRPMYPADLTESREHLALFLAQYFGGPATYSEQRGHPRLRMRHAPFAIGPAERDAWLARMREAVAWTDPPPGVADRLRAYFDMAAEAMRNRD